MAPKAAEKVNEMESTLRFVALILLYYTFSCQVRIPLDLSWSDSAQRQTQQKLHRG